MLVQLHRAVHGGLQLPAVHDAAILGAAVHVALPVHQLHRQRGDAQQLLIAGVGLDQAAAQAPFQRSRRHQAVNDGHIPQKLLDQGKMEAVKHRVYSQQHQRNGRQGQPPEDPGVPALVGDDPKGQQDADHDPPHHQTEKPSVLVVFVPGLLQPEHLLVQVVGQHQLQQHRRGQPQHSGPGRQAVALGSVHRQDQLNAEHRYPQHGGIVEVPQHPIHPRGSVQLEPQGAHKDPEQHQQIHVQQQPPHLRMHRAVVQGDPPPCEQAQIQQAPEDAAGFLQAGGHPLQREHPAQPCQQHHGAHRTASLNLFLLSLPHHASLLLLCRSPVVFLHYITSAL